MMKFPEEFVVAAKETLSKDCPEEKALLDIIKSGLESEHASIMDRVSMRILGLRDKIFKPETIIEILTKGRIAGAGEVLERAKKHIALQNLFDLYMEFYRNQNTGYVE